MQNDRNVSSNDNKNVSLDSIIDNYSGNEETDKKSSGKMGDAMKKLDEIFNREKEDLNWLDSILNGNTGLNNIRENNPGAEIPFNNGGIRIDNAVNTDDVSFENISGNISDADFSDDNSDFVQDIAGGDKTYEEVIRAENPDNGPALDEFSGDDDTKIFTSSHDANLDEGNPQFSQYPPFDNNIPPEMQGDTDGFSQQPVRGTDKKLERKRLKEEKRLAKAQAKAEKAARKAQYEYFSESTDNMYYNGQSDSQNYQQTPGQESFDGQTYYENNNSSESAPVYPDASVMQNTSADVYTEEAEGNVQQEITEDIYNNANASEDLQNYAEEAANDEQESSTPSEFAENENQDGGTPGFEMFEGTSPEGEYVHNMEMAAQMQENSVNSSLGKLFGVDIPDDDASEKGAKKKSEHKKIAKELGAYEEINMADTNAVDAARRLYFVKRRRSMIALFGATFFFLLSLYFELSMFGALPVPEIVSSKANPLMFALADLQIMCFGAIFVIDSLIAGFYSILDKRFSPASCALTVFVTCAIQAIISAVFASNVKLELFCCIGTLSLFMLALYDSLKKSADYKSFCIASSTANKYGAYELGVDSLECSPFASHLDLENAKVISVNKGSVYEGFVGRNEKRPAGEKKLGILTLIITIISIFVGVFVALFSDGLIKERIYEGITGAAIVLINSIPLNIFFVSALPKYLAVKKGNKIDATLIGQNASEEYKGLSVVAFEDTEVFLPKDVRISSIKTYGGMALDETVITMANIYNKIGGPLSRIFAKMVDVKSVHSDVKLVKVYPDAIEVTVDGRDFCLATASYLGANGIRIITDSVDAAFEQSHGSILFMVCDGRILAKFYIKYAMNPIFEKTLRELHDANLCIGIKTLDPCITNDLVFGCLERANYALSVIKGNSSGDIPTVRNKVNSGVISLGSVHSFLEMLLICEKTGRNVKINNVIKIISAILCVGLSTVFVLTNNGSLNIIFCLLLQLFWLLPVTAVSYLNR